MRANCGFLVCVAALYCRCLFGCATWYYATEAFGLHTYWPQGTIQAYVTYGQKEFKFQYDSEGEIINKTYTSEHGETSETLQVPGTFYNRALQEFTGATAINWPAVYPVTVRTDHK